MGFVSGFLRPHQACAAAAVAVALATAPVAIAASEPGGALPKGNTKALDKGKATGPNAKAAKVTSCYDHLVRPPGGNALFSGNAFFLLAHTSAIGKAGNAKAPTVRQTLYKLALKSAAKAPEAEAMLSLEHRASPALAASDDPVSAVSAVAFLGTGSPCFEGPAAVVSVALAKKGQQAVRRTGHHYFVEAPNGRLFVDMKKQAVLAVDPLTFQTKSARRLPEYERGLYFDPSSRSLVAWHDDGKQRGLVGYQGDDDKRPRRLAVAPGDRVLQQGGTFAIARATLANNAVQIQELASWSGVAKPELYEFKLPAKYKVVRLGMDVSFVAGVVVVHAVGFSAQKQWQRAFVVNYRSGETIGVLKAAPGSHVHYAGIDPKGKVAVAEIRDDKTRRTLALKLFDVATREIIDVSLPQP